MANKRKEEKTEPLLIAKKSSWDKIYEEFKQTYPSLSKKAVGYAPWGYSTIKVYLDDGMRLSYNSIDERAVVLKDSDKSKKE